MNISLKLVKKLREETGAGVMPCKKALEESGGDPKKAKVLLKERGAEIVAKKSARKTTSGIVEAYIHANDKIGVLVEVYCETDFVARNEDFRKLAHELALQIASLNPKDTKELMKQDYVRDPKRKVSDLIEEAIARFGENIRVGRFVRYEVGR